MKIIEDEDHKKFEDHKKNNCLNLMDLLKSILILTEIVYHIKNKKKKKKKTLNKLVEERSLEFQDQKKLIILIIILTWIISITNKSKRF